MKKLLALFIVLVGLGSLAFWEPARAQLGCTALTQAQILSSFSDNVPSGGITPQTMRNFVCSIPTLVYPSPNAPVISITDPAYGAKCDGVTDDGPAINLAFAVLRANKVGRITAPQGVKCKIVTGINATNLNPATSPGNGGGIIIDLGGAEIDCNVTGGVCIDAIGSKRTTWLSLNLVGIPANEPKIGLQIGRPATNQTASQQDFGPGVWIVGSFTEAALINYSSEVTSFHGGLLTNADNGAGAYVVMVDCYNHTGLTSAYTTITWAVDTAASCQGVSFNSTRMQQVGTSGPALWVGGALNFTVDRTSYLSSNGNNAVVLFSESSITMTDIKIDAHIETIPTLQSTILLSGNVASPTIIGLARSEDAAESAFSEVGLDFTNGVTGATLSLMNVNITGVVGSVQGTYSILGKYSTFATATVSAGGSGCTNGLQTFTVVGGLGNAAQVSGTVAGNSLSGALTIVGGGSYQTLPGSPATVTGGGCSVAPTITFTTSTTGAPMTVSGDVTTISVNYWQAPQTFGMITLTEDAGSVTSRRFLSANLYMSNLGASASNTTDLPICRTGAQLSAGTTGQPCGFLVVGTTGSIGGGALAAGACTSGTVNIAGAATTMVAVASPATYPGDGDYWVAYVSAAGVVTVKVCSVVGNTPTASTYNVRVWK